jgi:aminoglycoside phosphotransferase (APT) family kinase protein
MPLTPSTLNLDEVAIRATAALGPGAGVVDALRTLPGGLSSITLAGRLRRPGVGDTEVVVKVAPAGLPPVRNRDVLRQARLLRALAGAPDVAVPKVLGADPGQPPDVPPLFVMTLVAGVACEPLNGECGPLSPGLLRGRALAAARMLGALHSFDPSAAGLASEPVVTLFSEVDRWEEALGTVDADLARGHAAAASALRRHQPVALPIAICHGDWRLGNMLCEAERINAVIDWEIWARGDPRLDLGWFLTVSDIEINAFARQPAPGMPPPAELLDAYQDRSGGSVANLRWFLALTAFKQAATMGLILKRNRRRDQPDPMIEANAPQLPMLIERALAGASSVRT